MIAITRESRNMSTSLDPHGSCGQTIFELQTTTDSGLGSRRTTTEFPRVGCSSGTKLL
jgi:hypothetical protein